MANYSQEQLRDCARQLWEKVGRPQDRDAEFLQAARSELDSESEAADPGDQPNRRTIPG